MIEYTELTDELNKELLDKLKNRQEILDIPVRAIGFKYIYDKCQSGFIPDAFVQGYEKDKEGRLILYLGNHYHQTQRALLNEDRES